jgi:hypothetical protein
LFDLLLELTLLACLWTEASCCAGGGARPSGRIISRVVGRFFFVVSMIICHLLRMIEWTDLFPLPTSWFAWLPTAFLGAESFLPGDLGRPELAVDHWVDGLLLGAVLGLGKGSEDGFENGSSDGVKDGSSLGVEIVIREGYIDGYRSGIEDGLSLGDIFGIDEGAEDGAPLGVKVDIDKGREDGFDDHRRYE